MISVSSGFFEGCTGLKEVDIPEGIEWIDAEVFKDCISLESVTLPRSMVEVYEYAFKGCVNLRHIKMPATTVISDQAFVGCPENLTIERYF